MNLKNSILVVDDDGSTCGMLKLILDKKGFNVDCAMTGREALGKLKRKSFSVVLLDIKLPDVDGTELISVMKRACPGIKVIMITGYATKENAIKSLNSGASYYLTKPFDMDKVLSKIKEIINKQGVKANNVVNLDAVKSVGNMYNEENIKPFKIRKAIGYIEINYSNKKLRLEEISSAVNMKPTSLSRLWGNSMEVSISDFINEIRITNAKNMLTETTEYTSQIANKVGFNICNFNRVFKERTGISPTLWRSQARSNKQSD